MSFGSVEDNRMKSTYLREFADLGQLNMGTVLIIHDKNSVNLRLTIESMYHKYAFIITKIGVFEKLMLLYKWQTFKLGVQFLMIVKGLLYHIKTQILWDIQIWLNPKAFKNVCHLIFNINIFCFL